MYQLRPHSQCACVCLVSLPPPGSQRNPAPPTPPIPPPAQLPFFWRPFRATVHQGCAAVFCSLYHTGWMHARIRVRLAPSTYHTRLYYFFYCQHTGLYSFIHCWPFLAASKRQRRAWQRLAWRRRAYSASLRLVNSACVFSRPVPCSVLGR